MTPTLVQHINSKTELATLPIRSGEFADRGDTVPTMSTPAVVAGAFVTVVAFAAGVAYAQAGGTGPHPQ
ncbi:hypothetical protein ACFW1A_26560 [Kitasatospora sp. NPDC058965]|uniref:hypothetical protein n=1 Tax=Kitasatospora sp. NPDC058965 TaxID=3346682 RepID=UPI00368FB7C2